MPSPEKMRTPSLSGTILLFSETLDWHAKQLAGAVRKRGIRLKRLAFREVHLDTTKPTGFAIPGFEDALPAGVFVRGIPAGSFEQVTMRLGLLHALRDLGVPVWNDARAIEACIDKSMTSHLLAKAGIPTPATFAVQTRMAAAEIVTRELARGGDLVLKPLFGAQGRDLKLIRSPEDLPQEAEVMGAYYLQRFVPTGEFAQDFRVFVSGGHAIAAMMRTAREGEWITNVKQGGIPQRCLLTPRLRELAEQAAAVTGADYAGVDLIRDREGNILVLEVNSMPAWSGLQSVMPEADIAEILIEDFTRALEKDIPERLLTRT